MKRLLPLALCALSLAACDSSDDAAAFDAAAIVGTYEGTTEAVVGTDYFAPSDSIEIVTQRFRVTISQTGSAGTPLRMQMSCTTPESAGVPAETYACGDLVGRIDAAGALFYRSFDPAAEANGLRVTPSGQIATRRTGTLDGGIAFAAETTGELSARQFNLATTTTYRRGDQTAVRTDAFRTVKTGAQTE